MPTRSGWERSQVEGSVVGNVVWRRGDLGSGVGSVSGTGPFNLCLQGTCSSCAADGTYGEPGSASRLLPLAAGIPTFLFPQRNVAAPGHYSSAVNFSLVLAGGR